MAAFGKPIPYVFSRSKRRLFRTFKCEVGLGGHHATWFEDVVRNIGTDRLLVFEPTDENGLADVVSKSVGIPVGQKARLAVGIQEWLPFACQAVVFEPREEIQKLVPSGQEILGVYQNNLATTLFIPLVEEFSAGRPAGPAAFVGRIVLNTRLRPETEDRFKWILAHELTHAFDTLRFLAPAVMDWDSCWAKLFGAGELADWATRTFQFAAELLDQQYGSVNELRAVEQYWPSQARKWFSAWHREQPPSGNPD